MGSALDRAWAWYQHPKPPNRARDLAALALFAGIATYAGLGYVIGRMKP